MTRGYHSRESRFTRNLNFIPILNRKLRGVVAEGAIDGRTHDLADHAHQLAFALNRQIEVHEVMQVAIGIDTNGSMFAGGRFNLFHDGLLSISSQGKRESVPKTGPNYKDFIPICYKAPDPTPQRLRRWIDGKT
jgi:hypothetical protein